MTNATPIGDGRAPRLLTYTRSFDARTFVAEICLTSTEVEHLDRVLDRLTAVGAIALHQSATPQSRAEGLDATLSLLRVNVGSMVADAAIGAARFSFTSTPAPQTLIPVWPFEANDDAPDAMVAHGLLFGAPIDFHALRAKDDDSAEPVASVAGRFHRWRSAAGSEAMLGTAAIPGGEGAYAVFAALQAG